MNVARPLWILVRASLLSFVRQRVVQVPFILMALFSLFALAIGRIGIESPAAGTFLLNLGLSAAWLAGHLLALLLAVRQWPEEIEHRTLYPLLARPVDRALLLAGKWLACALAGTLATSAFMLLAWFATPHLEPCHPVLWIQQLVLLPFSIAMLCALAMWMSLWMPRGVAVLAGILMLLAGAIPGKIAGRIAAPWLEWLVLYLPDVARLNLVTRYTDGVAALDAGLWLALLYYAVAMTALPLLLAGRLLNRRSF